MSKKINTDVAVELDITARRNDTFKMLLEVKNPQDDTLIDLNADYLTNSAQKQYQAKMTIINSSGDEVLTLYSEYWNEEAKNVGDHPDDSTPSPSSGGHYTGGSNENSAIYLGAQTSTGGKAKISAPYEYMDFQSGEYRYDFQMRYREDSNTVVEYTTWLYGKFILKADITQL